MEKFDHSWPALSEMAMLLSETDVCVVSYCAWSRHKGSLQAPAITGSVRISAFRCWPNQETAAVLARSNCPT